jgi:glycosyltransferase involved in cell wall biosynthesis
LKLYTAVYRNWHPGYSWFGRDSGLVTQGLREIGVDSRLVILKSPDLPNDDRFLPATKSQFCCSKFWCELGLDAVVLQGGGEAATQPVADAIKESGTKLFYRMDTDGVVDPSVDKWLFLYGKWWTYANPYRYRYVKWEELLWAKEHSRGLTNSPKPVSINSNLKKECFALTKKWLSRPFAIFLVFLLKIFLNNKFGSGNIYKRLKKADFILVESKIATARLQRLISYFSDFDSSPKIITLPIPIPSFEKTPPSPARSNTVITAGRLYDNQKDAKLFVKVIAQFLRIRKDYNAIAIGDGFRYVEHLVQKYAHDVSDRIQILGRSSPEQIRAIEEKCKIFICTSRGESMHIASAEAVCAGCSIVGPAEIASIQDYVSFQSGSIAFTRRASDLIDAILSEANEWDAGRRCPSRISEFFSYRFSPLNHSKELFSLI